MFVRQLPSTDAYVLVLYQSVLGALKLLLSGDSADQCFTALAVPDTEPDSSSAASESRPVRLDRFYRVRTRRLFVAV